MAGIENKAPRNASQVPYAPYRPNLARLHQTARNPFFFSFLHLGSTVVMHARPLSGRRETGRAPPLPSLSPCAYSRLRGYNRNAACVRSAFSRREQDRHPCPKLDFSAATPDLLFLHMTIGRALTAAERACVGTLSQTAPLSGRSLSFCRSPAVVPLSSRLLIEPSKPHDARAWEEAVGALRPSFCHEHVEKEAQCREDPKATLITVMMRFRWWWVTRDVMSMTSSSPRQPDEVRCGAAPAIHHACPLASCSHHEQSPRPHPSVPPPPPPPRNRDLTNWTRIRDLTRTMNPTVW